MCTEGNPDVVNTINPADCPPDRLYMGAAGGERLPMQRNDAGAPAPWQVYLGPGQLSWRADREVSDLVRLVPARPVTRQDLPDDPDDRWETFRSRFKEFDGYRSEAHQHSLWTVFRSGIQYAETRMLDHLNANGGAPADPADQLMHEVNNPDPEKVALDEARIKANIERNEARRETARWRRAHEIVEGERDQARDSLHEACKVAQSYKVDAYQATERAEAAEARTAPAVTKADIEQAIRPKFEQWQSQLAVPVDQAIDAVCALFGVEAGQAADPVEELAGQLEAAARTAIRQVCDDLAAVAPTLDPLTVERAMEVTAASRKVAAHVLGQEDRHVDQ